MKSWISKIFNPVREKQPAPGYDLWAGSYDNQPDNLILRLDEEILGPFLQETSLNGRSVADIGCGTGRHWGKLFAAQPESVTGFDVSQGMLTQLQKKYPSANTVLLENNKLNVQDAAFDVIISTLTIAHIEALESTFEEWNRVLKPGGELIITDYHPEALQRDAKRTFRHQGKTIALKSYVHPLDKLRELSKQLGWTELRFTERVINEEVKHYYEKQQATGLYEKYYGMPLIYGIHLKKNYAAS